MDHETLTDVGAGVDVNAGMAVGILGHDARQQRNVQFIESMGQPMTVRAYMPG